VRQKGTIFFTLNKIKNPSTKRCRTDSHEPWLIYSVLGPIWNLTSHSLAVSCLLSIVSIFLSCIAFLVISSDMLQINNALNSIIFLPAGPCLLLSNTNLRDFTVGARRDLLLEISQGSSQCDSRATLATIKYCMLPFLTLHHSPFLTTHLVSISFSRLTNLTNFALATANNNMWFLLYKIVNYVFWSLNKLECFVF